MRVMIAGYGRMGKLIEETLFSEGDQVVARIDQAEGENTILPEALAEMDRLADVIMDFSSATLTEELVAYAARTETPLLSGTTNLTETEMTRLRELSEGVPVIWASNYSLGINLLLHILPEIAGSLPGWDVEITETHHNKKKDAPSGTARSLADVIDPAGEYQRVYGRSGLCGERGEQEIGIHVLRGGTEAGTHTVSFFGRDEVLELTHRATSRQILVDGAITAARRLMGKEPGLYDMQSLMFDL